MLIPSIYPSIQAKDLSLPGSPSEHSKRAFQPGIQAESASWVAEYPRHIENSAASKVESPSQYPSQAAVD